MLIVKLSFALFAAAAGLYACGVAPACAYFAAAGGVAVALFARGVFGIVKSK